MAAGVDVNTQQSFEALNQRAVAVVVDPIQSVKGKVVIDAFRSINPQMTMMGYEPRQTTSIIGHLNKPSIQALIHGLNRHYYSIAISYRKSELEEKMLMNLHKKGWTEGLKTADFKQHDKQNEETVKRMLDLAKAYNKAVQEEDEKTAEKFQIDQVCVPPARSSMLAWLRSSARVQPKIVCTGSWTRWVRCSRCPCDPKCLKAALERVFPFFPCAPSFAPIFSMPPSPVLFVRAGWQARCEEAPATGHRDGHVQQHHPVPRHHARHGRLLNVDRRGARVCASSLQLCEGRR